MGSRTVFFILVSLIIMGCNDPEPKRQPRDSLSGRDTVIKDLPKTDTDKLIDKNTVSDIVKSPESSDASLNCDTLLYKLIQTSDLGRGIRKFRSNVWVDSSGGGVAILRIHPVHGHEEGPIVGWLKLDYTTRQLWDVTPDTPILLTCDTLLFKKIIERCPIK